MPRHLAESGLDREGMHPLDELLARLPIGDQIRHRDLLEAVLLGKGRDLRALHHRAVVIGEFADHADLWQLGELAQVDGSFRMAGAHQHAAILGDQREDMAGTNEIGRAHIAVGQRANRVGALFGRNAGGQPVLDVDRNGEGGAERSVVRRHHRVEPQSPGLARGQRRADDAAGIADDEGHLLRRAERGGNDEVALVLAVIIIGDDDDLATGEGFDGLCDIVRHGSLARPGQAEEIIGGDGAARGGSDALGAFAGDPGGRIVAQRGHAGRRQADLLGEGAARDLVLPEPGIELHAGKLMRRNFIRNEAMMHFQYC